MKGTQTSNNLMIRWRSKDGETPYNVAGKNMKIRKLITELQNANLDDSDVDKAEEGEKDEEEEWEEAGPEEAVEAKT